MAALYFPYELHIVDKSVSHVLETFVSSLSTPHGTAFEILSLFFHIISLILLPVPGTPASFDISGLKLNFLFISYLLPLTASLYTSVCIVKSHFPAFTTCGSSPSAVVPITNDTSYSLNKYLSRLSSEKVPV